MHHHVATILFTYDVATLKFFLGKKILFLLVETLEEHLLEEELSSLRMALHQEFTSKLVVLSYSCGQVILFMKPS